MPETLRPNYRDAILHATQSKPPRAGSVCLNCMRWMPPHRTHANRAGDYRCDKWNEGDPLRPYEDDGSDRTPRERTDDEIVVGLQNYFADVDADDDDEDTDLCLGEVRAMLRVLERLQKLEPAKRLPWPLGINAQMDESAIQAGLGHWSCTSTMSNSSWIRRDGRVHEAFRKPTKLGTYVSELEAIDKDEPMRDIVFGAEDLGDVHSKAAAWCAVFDFCRENNMAPADGETGVERVLNFIQKLLTAKAPGNLAETAKTKAAYWDRVVSIVHDLLPSTGDDLLGTVLKIVKDAVTAQHKCPDVSFQSPAEVEFYEKAEEEVDAKKGKP